MKKEIFITKQDMIDAVKTEPLTPGIWIIGAGTKDCAVCATGGVLRAAGVHEHLISDVANNHTNVPHVTWGEYIDEYGESGHDYIDGLLKEYIDDHEYLAALSVKFEDLAEEYGMKQVRELLVTWIENNMPNDLNISIKTRG